MAQTDTTRLLLIPAIVLAAALSLSGCASLPFFGTDSGSSSGSSSRDEDEDDDESEDEDDDSDSDAGSGSCPQKFLDAIEESSDSSDFDSVTIREIAPGDFEPGSISDTIDGGCLLVLDYVQDDEPGTIYEAFIPGGQEVLDALEADLTGDGYESSSEGFYVGDNNSFVIVYSSDDSGLSQEDLDEQDMGFLGDEFVFITAYQGQV